jgi:hypothetical protein
MTRTLKFLPLTFIAGSWGFVIFVPYMLTFLAAAGLLRRLRPAMIPVDSRPAAMR